MPVTLDTLIELPLSKKVALWVGILFLISFLYFYLGYSPRAKALEEKRQTLANLQTELVKVRGLVERLTKFKKEVASMERKLEFFLDQLPSKEEIPILLDGLSRVGRESGLEFLLFKPQDEIRKDFYAEIPIEIKAFGEYHQLGIFFDKVGRLPRIVNITNLSIGEVKEIGEEIKVTASFRAIAFRFLEEGVGEKK